MSLAGPRGITLTISAGLTLLDPGRPLVASFERADTALRQAKAQGRNRLVVL
ncbi:MAG: diguanylate cyclase [Aliidongia sp.]